MSTVFDPSEPLVSVVTPVFNGEGHLRECIESVIAQTYRNWVYTLVDNCSTDRSYEIACEYMARDSRIRVVRNDAFVSMVENYNNAIRQTVPEARFCKVVGADDWLFPNCLEQMVRHALSHPNCAIVAAYGQDETNVRWVGLPFPSPVLPGREVCRHSLLGGRNVFGTQTSVLYDASIVRSRSDFFRVGNAHHFDAEACLEFLEGRDFGFVHQVLTFQRVRSGSATSYSERMQTYLPWKIQELQMYGPRYLTHEEIRRRMKTRLDYYYRFLARELFNRREPEFWEYHRKALAELKLPLSRTRLWAQAIGRAMDLLLNPKYTLEHIVAPRLKRSREVPVRQQM